MPRLSAKAIDAAMMITKKQPPEIPLIGADALRSQHKRSCCQRALWSHGHDPPPRHRFINTRSGAELRATT
jgi:hypothetical protein